MTILFHAVFFLLSSLRFHFKFGGVNEILENCVAKVLGKVASHRLRVKEKERLNNLGMKRNTFEHPRDNVVIKFKFYFNNNIRKVESKRDGI